MADRNSSHIQNEKPAKDGERETEREVKREGGREEGEVEGDMATRGLSRPLESWRRGSALLLSEVSPAADFTESRQNKKKENKGQSPCFDQEEGLQPLLRPSGGLDGNLVSVPPSPSSSLSLFLFLSHVLRSPRPATVSGQPPPASLCLSAARPLFLSCPLPVLPLPHHLCCVDLGPTRNNTGAHRTVLLANHYGP